MTILLDVSVSPVQHFSTGEQDAMELGNKVSGAMTMEETKKSLRNIHNIVSMQVSYTNALILVVPHTVPADRS